MSEIKNVSTPATETSNLGKMPMSTIKNVSIPALESPRPHAPHQHDAWMAGDRAPQGDLILISLKALPKSAKPREDRQMAEGNTRGARHFVQGGKVWEADKDELAQILTSMGITVDKKYIGPVFSGACTLTHPKHAHQIFPEHGATVVIYQRNLDAEEKEQRRLD